MRLGAALLILLTVAGCSLPIPEGEEQIFSAAGKLRKEKELKDAYRFYEAFVQRYPASRRSDEALVCMYEIALSRSETAWGHHRLRDLLEQFPAALMAAEAVFMIGKYRFNNKSYDEAINAFETLTESYSESERVEAAVYLSGESHLGQYEGPDYESRPLRDARENFELLLKVFPAGAYGQRAKKRVRQIDKELARRDFFTALYYRKHGKPESARVYLKSILKQYPETEYAKRAEEMLSQ